MNVYENAYLALLRLPSEVRALGQPFLVALSTKVAVDRGESVEDTQNKFEAIARVVNSIADED